MPGTTRREFADAGDPMARSTPTVLALSLTATLWLAGCVTSRAELLGSEVHAARSPDHPILVYDELSDVPKPFVKVGIVHGNGAPAAS